MGKISAMTLAASVAGDNEFEINENFVTKKVTAQQIKDFVLPYKRYVATLDQTGTNAPVATVLENTLSGTLVWTRNSAGVFFGTLANEFPDPNKVIIFVTPTATRNILAYSNSVNRVQITSELSGVPTDNMIYYSLEVRVYT